MKPLRLLCLSILAAGAALAQAPTITAVENAATNIPPGLPNAGVAQGALFVVKGTNLGPGTLAIATAFPFTTTIGGASIQVTVGGTTVDAIMYYALSAQLAAILPSRTPTGTGTVRVTYNGQSASGPITVVQNNIGIFTVDSSGGGDAIAFLPDNGLITPSHAANPGDTVTFWGTGLGPVTSDETRAAVQADMTNVPLQVFIGGKPATILFRGRNACCTAVDTVYVTVPQGVTGCAVSVIMQIGNLVSNTTTIAVAASGRACTPVNPNLMTFGTGTHTFGGFGFTRIVISTAGIGTFPGTTTSSDTVGGGFFKITYSATQQQGSQVDVNSYGSCTVTQTLGRPTPPPNTATIQYLDAGASIALAAPFGNRVIPRGSPAAGITIYQANLDMTATTLTAGQYTLTGTGGVDVGAFTANYTMPPPFAWTNQSSITTVNRANGVTVTWTGGDPAGYVTIAGQSILAGTAATTVVVGFTCTARVSDGAFTVPPIVLLPLPPSTTIAGTMFTLPGVLTVSSYSSNAQSFQAPGIEAAGTTSAFIYGSSVTYQ